MRDGARDRGKKEELQGKLNPNASPEEIRQMLEFGNKSRTPLD